MKLLNKFSLLLLSASFAFTACERDYDAPPLSEPECTGPAANTTIAELRELGASATQDVPFVIAGDFVLKATVTGNDESGNIYKKIYFQDETSAIEMEVDQNSVYNYYPVGQVVYVNLKGLSISVYGDEQQLGHPDGYLYRTPWETFQEVVSKDGWANPENAKPTVIDDISTVNTNVDGYKFKLVQFTNVSFANGGKNIFAPESGYGEENIVDSHGNTLMVRTSNYADFAGQTLPAGRGNVTGILGRFNGTWQLTLRSINDVADFTGENTGDGEQGGETEENVIFSETFGTPERSGSNWPFFKDYNGFDNPKEMFEDESGKASVRIANNYTNVWYPTGSDINIKIKGINAQGQTVATLVYEAGANVYEAGETQDLNTLKVRCNGTELTVPSKVVTGDDKQGNTPFKFTFENVNVSDDTTLEFYTTSADNTYGLRLYNVKLYTATSGGGSQGGNTGDGGTPIEPIPTNN